MALMGLGGIIEWLGGIKIGGWLANILGIGIGAVTGGIGANMNKLLQDTSKDWERQYKGENWDRDLTWSGKRQIQQATGGTSLRTPYGTQINISNDFNISNLSGNLSSLKNELEDSMIEQLINLGYIIPW